MKKRFMAFLLVLAMLVSVMTPLSGFTVLAETPEDPGVTAGEETEAVVENVEVEMTEETESEKEITDTITATEEDAITRAEDSEKTEEDAADEIEYRYGTVDMSYADFYYGELNDIAPDKKTEITPVVDDPVETAGYTEEGMYDAATFATPRTADFKAKWSTDYKHTYSEPIYNESGALEGGRILGVARVNVAISKKLYEAAMSDASAEVLRGKIAQITFYEENTEAPKSYKVLNSDAVYSKYVGADDSDRVLQASRAEAIGDDNWWDTTSFRDISSMDSVLGGFVEWTENPADPSADIYRAGLKHEENIFSTGIVGWGVGPGAIGIYGDHVGWKRFEGISGKYMTKLTLVVDNGDGSVTYYNANSETGIRNPLHLNGIVDENGEHPYDLDISLDKCEITNDRIILVFEGTSPLVEGTMNSDANYQLNWVTAPSSEGVLRLYPEEMSDYNTRPKVVRSYKVSDWENGHMTIRIELRRNIARAGRYVFSFTEHDSAAGSNSYGSVIRAIDISTGLTNQEMYIEDSKLKIDSDLFTVDEYRTTPFQAVVIEDSKGNTVYTDTTFSTNRVSSSELFEELLDKEGNFTRDKTYFPGIDRYTVTLYCSGYPAVKGYVNCKNAQEISLESDTIVKNYGDPSFNLGAVASTDLTYESSDENVAAVDANGMVTIKDAGTTVITVKAAETETYLATEKTVTLTVNKLSQKITAKSYTKTYGDKAFSLGAKASTPMTYTSSNKKVVIVAKNGKVTIKGVGTAAITIKAAETAGYKATSAKVTIKVKPKKAVVSKTASTKKATAVVTWKKDATVTGYELQYSLNKNFKSGVKTVKVSKNTTVTTTIKKLKSQKTYYVRIRGYKTVGKEKLYGAYSAVKSVKVK